MLFLLSGLFGNLSSDNLCYIYIISLNLDDISLRMVQSLKVFSKKDIRKKKDTGFSIKMKILLNRFFSLWVHIMLAIFK